MYKILESRNFGLKIYNRFPLKYREEDINQKFALKRYLQVIGEGGFKYAIEDVNGLLKLIDPDNVDEKVLEILFLHYGLEIFNGIPKDYLRYLLPKLGELYSMKGSIKAVENVCAFISGIKTTTTVENEKDNSTVIVRLEMDTNLGEYVPNVNQLNRILRKFIPFYCDLSTIYSYVFYENAVILGIEKTLFNVKEKKAETTVIKSNKDNDILSDSFLTIYDESNRLKGVIDIIGKNKIGYIPIYEEGFINKNNENTFEKRKIIFNEKEENRLSSNEGISEKFIFIYEEKNGLRKKTLSNIYSETLNKEDKLINSSFILNERIEGEDIDELVLERIFISDKSSLTGMDYIIEGNIQYIEKEDIPFRNKEEELKEKVFKEYQEDINMEAKEQGDNYKGFILNLRTNKLNEMQLGIPNSFDKVYYKNGDVSYVYN